MSNSSKRQDGYFLVSAIVMILFLTAIGLAIAQLTSVQYQHAKRAVYTENAQLLAEAAVEQTVSQLNANDDFAGYTNESYFNNTDQGVGTFSATITTNADESKTVTTTGRVCRSANFECVTRRVRVNVVGTSSGGYSVLSGPGGLILGGSANITNSDVYVSGTITMSGAAKIGTYSNPVNVWVANNACPTGATPGPTYPQVCSSGQPITLAQSTNIYGTVCATGQTSAGPNNNIQAGDPSKGFAGLQVGCTAPVYPPTIPDKAAQVAAVTTTGAGNNNTYVCNSWPFDRSWPANLKLTGNVSVSSSCNVTVNGNVYITGNFDFCGAAVMRVANSLGTTRPVVLVDGTINVGCSANVVTNSSGTGIEFISFKSAGSCNPNCTTLTGNDLKTSQGQQNITVGGAVNMPGVVFNAVWSKVSLGGSGNVGAAAGQTVDLSGAGTVVFGTSLASGSKTWAITSYQPLY